MLFNALVVCAGAAIALVTIFIIVSALISEEV